MLGEQNASPPSHIQNIAYGLPDDEATMPQIIKAAQIANIHDFIVSLPKGYETEVGEHGSQLRFAHDI